MPANSAASQSPAVSGALDARLTTLADAEVLVATAQCALQEKSWDEAEQALSSAMELCEGARQCSLKSLKACLRMRKGALCVGIASGTTRCAAIIYHLRQHLLRRLSPWTSSDMHLSGWRNADHDTTASGSLAALKVRAGLSVKPYALLDCITLHPHVR